MHIIINTGKENVVIVQVSEEATTLPMNKCGDVLFMQDIILTDSNQEAQLFIVQKDDPSTIISERVGIQTRPAERAFIHTVDAMFVQGQEVFVGIATNEAEEITLFLHSIMDIIPNGYL